VTADRERAPGRRAPSDRSGLIEARWMARLRDLGRAALAGDPHAQRSALDGAPKDVRDAAALLLVLSRRATRRDAALASARRRDAALQRELHHRVRNNLQIIASHLALGEAEVEDVAARRVLAATRLRVAALALTHRLLWDGGAADGLSLRTLVEAVADLAGAQLGRIVAVELASASHWPRFELDLAVPLSLWTVEALCALCPEDGGTDEGAALRLAVAADRDGWRLTVRSNVALGRPLRARDVRLLDGHAAQLPDGRSMVNDPGAPSDATLTFRLP
jgi:hypothetical protein